MPVRQLNSVVLPAPLGPMSPVISPGPGHAARPGRGPRCRRSGPSPHRRRAPSVGGGRSSVARSSRRRGVVDAAAHRPCLLVPHCAVALLLGSARPETAQHPCCVAPAVRSLRRDASCASTIRVIVRARNRCRYGAAMTRRARLRRTPTCSGSTGAPALVVGAGSGIGAAAAAGLAAFGATVVCADADEDAAADDGRRRSVHRQRRAGSTCSTPASIDRGGRRHRRARRPRDDAVGQRAQARSSTTPTTSSTASSTST